jgi:hypothetical protein
MQQLLRLLKTKGSRLFVAPEQIDSISQRLEEAGLGIRHYQDGLHQPLACLGEMCPMFEQDALGAAIDMSQELSSSAVNNPLKIGINGCNRCCVATHTLDISIVGESNGYRVSFGGKNSQLPEMASYLAEGVPAEKLSSKIANIVKIYQEKAIDQESLQELIERVGTKDFVAALAPYSQDAAGSNEFAELNATSLAPEEDLSLLEIEDAVAESPLVENSSVEMETESFDFENSQEAEAQLPEIETDAIAIDVPLDAESSILEIETENSLIEGDFDAEAVLPEIETDSTELESPLEIEAVDLESDSDTLEMENPIDSESLILEEQAPVVVEESMAPEVEFTMESNDFNESSETTLDSEVMIAEELNSDDLIEDSSETGMEMNEDLADEFESKLNTEIAFAAKLPEDESIDPEQRGAELEDIENNAISSEPAIEDEFSMLEDEAAEASEQVNMNEQVNINEKTNAETTKGLNFGQPKLPSLEKRKNVIVGVELVASQLQLNMSSGLVVEIDLNELISAGARTLNISGSKLDLKIEQDYLELKSGDMKLKLPLNSKNLAVAA